MKTFAGRWGSRGGQLLLTLTAVVGALCAVLAVLAVVFGVRPIVFRSGSMAPAVDTGALGFSRSTDAADLRVGDVVTVTNAQQKTVTHRITAIGSGDGSVTLQLKGDDNPVADQEVYRVEAVPRLWFAVPDAGYVIAWFSKAPGSYLLGGYVMLMLMLAFRRRQDSEPSGGIPVLDEVGTGPGPAPTPPVAAAPKSRRGPFAVVTAGAIVALAAAVVSGWSQTTWAAWNDTVEVTGTTITTGTWGGGAVTCTSSGNVLTLNWNYTPDPTTKFIIRSNGTPSAIPGTPVDVAKTLRTWSSTGFNTRSGEVWVVAVNGITETELAPRATYVFGNGNGGGNKSCAPAP